jgi:hypothetical protein
VENRLTAFLFIQLEEAERRQQLLIAILHKEQVHRQRLVSDELCIEIYK